MDVSSSFITDLMSSWALEIWNKLGNCDIPAQCLNPWAARPKFLILVRIVISRLSQWKKDYLNLRKNPMFKYVAVGICLLTLNKFCLEFKQFKYQKIRTRKNLIFLHFSHNVEQIWIATTIDFRKRKSESSHCTYYLLTPEDCKNVDRNLPST